jgi:hypothetical protein
MAWLVGSASLVFDFILYIFSSFCKITQLFENFADLATKRRALRRSP